MAKLNDEKWKKSPFYKENSGRIDSRLAEGLKIGNMVVSDHRNLYSMFISINEVKRIVAQHRIYKASKFEFVALKSNLNYFEVIHYKKLGHSTA
jgi:hypothetical protein